MKKAILFALSLTLSAGVVLAKDIPIPKGSVAAATVGGKEDMKEAKELSDWMTYYYQKPKPELVVHSVELFSKLSDKLKDNSALPYSAALSIVMSKNTDKIVGWVKQMSPFLKNDRVKATVCNALWLSNNPAAKEQLKSLASQTKEPLKSKFVALADRPPISLRTMPLESAGQLDMLWGAFMISGDKFYVERIMTVLPGAKGSVKPSEKNIERYLMQEAARWSVISNAQQHKIVMQVCRDEVKKHPEYKTALKDLKIN